MALEIIDSPVERSPSPSPIRQNPWFIEGHKSRGWLTLRKFVMFAVAAAFGLVLLIFAGYFMRLVFTKPQQVQEGGIGYALFISKFVKELPVFKPLENSTDYYFNMFTDDTDLAYIVRYQSKASPEEIISYYRLYFEILNYTHVKHAFDSSAMAIFRNTREEFTVFVSAGEGVYTVAIENVKYD